MKRQSVILTFIPWIVFSSSAGPKDFLTGAIVALVLNIVIAREALLRGVVLEIGGTLFFAAMVVLGLLVHSDNTFIQYPNLWSNLAMMLIMFGSVLINKPFTEQYTDKGTHQMHLRLSSIWGSLLLLASLFSMAHAYFGLSNTVSTIGTVVAILLGVKANVLYPKWFYRKKV